jgi:glutaminyl-tRNA synthetase
MIEEEKKLYSNFIQDIIDKDFKTGRFGGRVHTRFPPEPNGYLHIGHAKSICLNFGIALQNDGLCNLRFDDTNPGKEEVEYVEAIKQDITWLGFDWGDRLYFASDYFDQIYQFAVELIKQGRAYVCDLNQEEIRTYRGTLTEPGKPSPYRNRSIEENLNLFEQMKNGEFSDGAKVLRAKIDMSAPNLNMRDPVIYRILRATHHRTYDKWCIYPMYDFAHPLSDALEKITHSICTLEFEDHRPLYDWFLENLDVPCKSQQIEFARLNLNYTVMSKRKLLELVKTEVISGWDDPRMPTLSGLRRRGYTPASIRAFAEKIGVSKSNSVVDIALLEHCIREELNANAARIMVVLKPIKLIIDNYPEEEVEWFETENNPENPEMGARKIPFSKVLYIEEDDFCENPPKGYYRLYLGNEVRLKQTYCVTCTHCVKDEKGKVIEVHCTYDPASKGGTTADGRKVKGTIHWVCVKHAVEIEVRLYDRLFNVPNPDEGDYHANLNPESLEILQNCKAEYNLKDLEKDHRYQFFRTGYFYEDLDSTPAYLVFNQIVTLKESWGK